MHLSKVREITPALLITLRLGVVQVCTAGREGRLCNVWVGHADAHLFAVRLSVGFRLGCVLPFSPGLVRALLLLGDLAASDVYTCVLVRAAGSPGGNRGRGGHGALARGLQVAGAARTYVVVCAGRLIV